MDSYEETFAKHLLKFAFPGEHLTLEKVPESTQSEPDIIVPEKKLIIEVKRIVSTPDLQRSHQWRKSTDRLKEELEQFEWQGEYHLSGDFISIPRNNDELMKVIAKEIYTLMMSLSDKDTQCRSHISNRYWMTIGKVSDEHKELFFSASEFSYGGITKGKVASIVKPLVDKASKQISSYQDRHPNYKTGWILFGIEYFKLWTNQDFIATTCELEGTPISQAWGINFNPSSGEAGEAQKLL
jgi:hypothetical protein